MLRLSAIRSALRLAQAVGHRQYGHFDRDAMAATGPQVSRKRASSKTGVSKHEKNSTGQFRAVQDPVTGERIYTRDP